MEVLQTVFEAVVVIFIVATMFGVGLSTTFGGLGNVFTNGWFVLGALVASLLAIPLLGWGIAELFNLPTASYIALVLLAASAGGPFSVALNKNQKGDVVSGAAMMVLLALIGSVATPLIADWLFGLSDTVSGAVGSINVGELVRTIIILQVIPLFLGMSMSTWTPGTASSWNPPVERVASVSFIAVMAGMLLGGFRDMIALFGTRTLLAAAVAGLLFFAAGWLLSPGPERLRSTGGFVGGVRNVAPVLVIALGAFADVEGLVPAIITILLVTLILNLFLASYLGNRHAQDPEDLTIVEGIGPEIETVLHDAGITTLYELGTTSSGEIEIILTESDLALNLARPGTWPRQASLAAMGEDNQLARLQEELIGGVEPDKGS